MKISLITKIYLILSGLLLAIIGSLTTFNPIAIKADEGILIDGNASALNDVRSFGTLLIAIAVLSLLGAFITSLRKTAVTTTLVLFTALGLGRLLSMNLDGLPSDGIIKATGLELLFGLAGIAIYIIYRKKEQLLNN